MSSDAEQVLESSIKDDSLGIEVSTWRGWIHVVNCANHRDAKGTVSLWFGPRTARRFAKALYVSADEAEAYPGELREENEQSDSCKDCVYNFDSFCVRDTLDLFDSSRKPEGEETDDCNTS